MSNGSLQGGDPGLALVDDRAGGAFNFHPGAPLARRSGADFAASIAGLNDARYQDAVLDAALNGELPECFGRFSRVDVTSRGRQGTFWISPMALSIGTDAGCFHAPTSSRVVARIAEQYNLMLPTSRMIDLARELPAAVHVPFHSQDDHQGVDAFLASSDGIEQRRAGRVGTVVDYFKTYVISNMRLTRPAYCCIYGAWNSDGRKQSRSVVHSLGYYDYSQQGVFVWPRVLVDGAEMATEAALSNAASAHLFSDEGVIRPTMLRYPT